MNRNFAKISVVIVALMLALACCLTGCKADDVAADLDTTKNEVTANKADAAKALEEATKALEAKIAANQADCAAEIAAVNAAIKAAKEANAATEASIASAEAALNKAIDAVRTSLDNAKKELSDKITANDAKINAEVAALNTAIENAEAALKAADFANKTELESSLAAAKAELEAAVAVLKADIAKLTEYVNTAVADVKEALAADQRDLVDAVVALQNALKLAQGEAANADTALKAELEQAIAEAAKAVMEVVEAADAAIKEGLDYATAVAESALYLANTLEEKSWELEDRIAALEAALETYKDTTEKVVEVWNEIYAIYAEWNKLCADHSVEAEVKAPVDKEYQLAQVLLSRATNADEVDAVKANFIAVVAKAQGEVPSLDNLNKIYAALVSVEEELAKDETNLGNVETALLEVKAGLAAVAFDTVMVDGVAVDLSEKYDAACVVYNAERVAAVYATIESVEAGIRAVVDYNDIWDEQAKAFDVEPLIAELEGDVEIPVDAKDIAALYAAYNKLCAVIPDQLLDLAVNVYLNTGDTTYAEYCLEDAGYEIDALPVDTEGLADLKAKYTNVQAEIVSAYMALANKAVEEAADIAALRAVLANIDTNLAAAKANILNMEAGELKTAAVAAYVAVQQAKLAKMETVALEALAAATTIDAVNAAESYKNDISAALTALESDEIGVDTTAFAGTYEEISVLAAEKVVSFAVAALGNAEDTDAVEAVADIVAVAKAKLAALTASAEVDAMNAKCDQITALIALVAEGENVAAIIAHLEPATIVGVNAEYEVIKSYQAAFKAFVESLDTLYVGFEATTGYDTIKAVANEAKFIEIKAAFDEKIAELIKIAEVLIETIKTINAKVVSDGYNFALIEDIEAAWDALHTWEQNATDADGVGFVIAYVSDGEYTNENLNTVISTIQTEYNAHVKAAQDDWATCYTDYYKSLTVENLTWTETALTAVRKWFATYGTNAADYEIANVGTAVEEAALKVLEEKLAELQAERKALVEKLAADAAALQERVDTLGFVTTDSEEAVKALRADVEAWKKAVADNTIDFVAEFGKAVAIDETALATAEAKLVDLEAQIENIESLIDALVIPTIGNDYAAPYFADVAAKDAYVAQVKVITDAIAKFNTDNDGNRECISEADLAKVAAANSELFVAKYEAALDAYATYEAAKAGVTDATVLAQLEAYLVAARKDIDNVGLTRSAYADTFAAILAVYTEKVTATVDVYNEYVAAGNGITNETVVKAFDAYLKEAVAAIAGTEVDALDALVEFYTLKFDTVVTVHTAYGETLNGVSDAEVIEIMNTYFEAAIREVSNTAIDSTNAKAYIAQIGTNATKKFNDIKEGNGLPVCQEHTYTDNCDAVCDECYYNRVAPHAWASDCDVVCENCPATREAAVAHNYANACDVDCGNCGFVREVPDHVYTDVCDEECDCGATRVAPHKWANACDAECDCGKTREVEGHKYDNACDAVCNTCNETTREVEGHKYENACDVDCNNCGETRTTEHDYDNDCDVDCNNCGETRTITHVDADLDFTCDTVGCGTQVIPAEGTTLTIAQFLALGKITTTTAKYYVTGTVKNVYNFTYGNMYITDGTNELCVYGTYSADGSVRYDKMTEKPVAGDTVTLYGIVSVYQGAVQMGSNSVGNRLTAHVPHEHDYKAADCVNPASCKLCGATTGEALGHTEANAEGKCDKCGATVSSSVKYVKVTNEADFTSGTYVIVCSNGVGLGSLSGTWITTAAPTIVGNEVTDAVGATWTLTVNGSTVTLTDANGVAVKPLGGNTNGIESGSYNWTWSMDANGLVTFKGTGTADTTTLASNTGSQNKFRAYKNSTVAGNTAGYPCTFEVYKLVE